MTFDMHRAAEAAKTAAAKAKLMLTTLARKYIDARARRVEHELKFHHHLYRYEGNHGGSALTKGEPQARS